MYPKLHPKWGIHNMGVSTNITPAVNGMTLDGITLCLYCTVIYYYVLYITPRFTLHYRNCFAVYHYVTMRRYEPVDIP